MRKIINFLSIAAVSLALVSCIKENPWGKDAPQNKNGETEVLLRLRTPGGFSSPASRGLTFAQENQVDNVYVLVFNSDHSALLDIQKADRVEFSTSDPDSGVSGTGDFSVTLPQTMGTSTVNLVTLANAESTLIGTIGTDGTGGDSHPGTSIGSSYATVMPLIHASIAGKMFAAGGVIPMWGETGQVQITPGSSQSIQLVRSVARIDVGVGIPSRESTPTSDEWTWNGKQTDGTTIGFILEEVYLMRPNDLFAVAPAPAKRTGNIATAPTIPTGITPFTAAASETLFAFTDPGDFAYGGSGLGGWTARRIYAPEAWVIDPSGQGGSGTSMDEAHEQRMAIVVGGRYVAGSNTTTYYRLDFAKDGNLLDVLRNHLYQFNIVKVSGDGYADPQTAYRSKAMNMTADILDWEDGELDNMYFDGTNYFHISDQEVIFSPFGGETHTVTIRTNVPDFSLTMGDMVLRPGVSHTSADGYFDYSLSAASGSTYLLTVESLRPNITAGQAAPRVAVWNIAANRLKATFTVRQQHTRLYVSIVNGASTVVAPEGVTGNNSIPIDIVSLVPVDVVVSYSAASSGWLAGATSITTPESENGLYRAHLMLTVPPFRLVTDGMNDRSATVEITPRGETPIRYTITQRAPFIILNRTSITVHRSDEPVMLDYLIDVLTNLPHEDIALTPNDGTNGEGWQRITVGEPLTPIDDMFNDRFQRFGIRVDLSSDFASLPTGAFNRSFTVSPPAGKYGDLAAVTTVVSVPSSEDVFNFWWHRSAYPSGALWQWEVPTRYDDAGINYVFPWNTAQIEFDVVTNMQNLALDEAVSTLMGGSVSEADVSFPDGGNTVQPYNFTLNNPNYNSVASYTLAFTALKSGDPQAMDMRFQRGIQVWSGLSDGTSSAVFGYTGGESNHTITNNLEWSVASSPAAAWLTVKVGEGSFTATPVVRNDRFVAPVAELNYSSNTHLVKSTPVAFSIAAETTLNPAWAPSQSTTVQFRSTDRSAVQNNITITRYAPVLEFAGTSLPSSSTPPLLPVPTAIPVNGGTYTVTSNTNLQGWSVRAYSGSGNTGAVLGTWPFGSTPLISATAAPASHNVSIVIAQNTTGEPQTMTFYLTSTEFPETTNEILIGTWTQEGLAPVVSGEGDILYFDRTGNAVLQVGQWGDQITNVNQMLFFKFGSVIGFTVTESVNAAWSTASPIFWNPSTLSTSSFGASYGTVPHAGNSGSAINLGFNVSLDSYHTLANVRAGFGDPCRLVGMTPAQIAGFNSDAELYAAEQGWRLPTARENIDFVGSGPQAEGTGAQSATSWNTWYPGITDVTAPQLSSIPAARRSGGWSNSNLGVAHFPIHIDGAPLGAGDEPAHRLPAAARRMPTGTGNVGSRGAEGYYWSSTARNGTNGFALFFNTGNVGPVFDYSYAASHSVRCVRATP
jgi:hypothetical protein